MQVIFESPEHPNGGCIFADPLTILLPIGGGASLDRAKKKIIAENEDEIILAVIQTFLEVVNA